MEGDPSCPAVRGEAAGHQEPKGFGGSSLHSALLIPPGTHGRVSASKTEVAVAASEVHSGSPDRAPPVTLSPPLTKTLPAAAACWLLWGHGAQQTQRLGPRRDPEEANM